MRLFLRVRCFGMDTYVSIPLHANVANISGVQRTSTARDVALREFTRYIASRTLAHDLTL